MPRGSLALKEFSLRIFMEIARPTTSILYGETQKQMESHESNIKWTQYKRKSRRISETET